MMKIYKMPNGLLRRYEEGTAPEGAELLNVKVKEPEPEVKAAPEVLNKAITAPKNKATTKKGSKK